MTPISWALRLRPPSKKRKHPTILSSLKKALKGDKISIIAEIKFASPSEGIILKKGEHIQIAKDYENAGAAAISVLTDRRFFNGDIKFLKDIKNAVNIPVMQKDFIISKKQILQDYKMLQEKLDSNNVSEKIAEFILENI